MLPYAVHVLARSGRGDARRARRHCPHDRRHLPGGVPPRSTRPHQHRRRTLQHLDGGVGRAQADHTPDRGLSRQHLLSASLRARVLRGQLRRRSDGRAGVAGDEEPVHDAQRGVSGHVRDRVRRCVLSRAVSDGQSSGGGRGRDPVRVLSVHFRAHRAHAAAVHRQPSVLHAGIPPAGGRADRSRVRRASASSCGRRPCAARTTVFSPR